MRLPILLAALPATALLAGCGHGATAGTAGASQTSDKVSGMLQFTQCMRAHGVDIPDPQTGGGGHSGFVRIQGGPGTGINPSSTTFQNAQSTCQHLLPNGGQLTPQQQAQAQQNALAYARCMRAHGVDIPDPQPGSSGPGIHIGGPGSGVNINPDDPAFQSAQQACGSALGKVGTFSIGGGRAPAGGGGNGGFVSGGAAVAGG